MEKFIVLKEEVALALKEKRGVVALESTIITHGMEFPQNIETAMAVEEEIRAEGCIPATIAIMDGIIHVGLSKE
jgi:pseudouridine-5'-phosphate glycosidase